MLYIEAPEGVIVKLCPEQMVPLLTAMVGRGLTTTLDTAAVAEMQPCALVPVTEKLEVEVGDTTCDPLEYV
jgi:hypothetical protein